jgi:hypothetical protein
MGLSKDGRSVVLMIADHLPWDDENHLLLIEKKIGSYLHFVESGQLVEQLPQAAGRMVEIDLRCLFEPKGAAIRFLEAAKRQLSEAHIGLSYGSLPPGY